MDILLASLNPGKVKELTELLSPFGAHLRTLAEFPDIPDLPENEPTFEANAIAKAQYYCKQTGLPTIADDGGLEIDVLSGWPGVRSRRIFGDGRRGTDEELVTETLRRLDGVPPERRGCQMRVVLAFAAPDGTTLSATGVVRGTIALAPSSHLIPGYPFRSLFVLCGWTVPVSDIEGQAEAGVMTQRRDAIRALLPKIARWQVEDGV